MCCFVTGISMPRMDGFIPTDKIRKIDTKTRLFFMTVLGFDYDALLEINGARLIRNLRDLEDLVKRVIYDRLHHSVLWAESLNSFISTNHFYKKYFYLKVV